MSNIFLRDLRVGEVLINQFVQTSNIVFCFRTPDIELHKKATNTRDPPLVKEEGDNSVFDGGGGEEPEQKLNLEEDKNKSFENKEKQIKMEETVDGKKGVPKNDSENENENEKRCKGEDKTSKDIKIKQEIIAQQEQRSQLHQEEKRLENEEIKRLQEEILRREPSREEIGEKKTDEMEEEHNRSEQYVRDRDNTVAREQDDIMHMQQESRIHRIHEGLRIKQEGEWNSPNSSPGVVSEQRRSTVSSDRGPVIENQDRQWHNPVSERWQSPLNSDRIKYPPVHSDRVIVERQQPGSVGVIERVRLSPEQARVRSSPEHRIRLSPEHARINSEQLRLRLSPEQTRNRLSPEHQPRLRLSPEQQQRLSPLIQKGSPVIQRQISGGEQNNSPGVLNMMSPGAFWVNPGSGGRINGVRPELIGGNMNMNVAFSGHGQTSDMKPPRPVSTPATPVMTRQTPTVIMGEAGGVRTMIWSQPSPSSPADHPTQNLAASTSTMNWSSPQSSAGGASSNSSEESAAQLLLNLGQPERQQLQQQLQQTPQNQQQQQSNVHYSQPLNMERLWAGDLTQLPASQQNQALNLALPPGAWPREGKPQGMTVIGESRHDPEDDEQPMICMICEDRATGLHYGIITCEG